MEEAANKAPTAQQITAIKAAIQNAQTLKEVEELEKALVTGHVPSEFKVGAILQENLTGSHELEELFVLLRRNHVLCSFKFWT